jgi:prepilin-type N-terminal cleavage/methylation domain-containing protein
VSVVRRARGFTLIEVLLGVLILGVGLLGLASVFPLVVKKQRDAQDLVLGISSVKGVDSVLRGHAGLNTKQTDRGWAKFSTALKDVASKNAARRVQWSDVVDAAANKPERIYGSIPQIGELRPEPGSIVFWGSGNVSSIAPDTVILRTSDRLIPQGPGASPQYVWDIVPILAGPLPIPAPQFPAIRAAIFVRRIDTGIRVPIGSSLTEVIAGGATNGVAAIAWNSSGFPTFDGNTSGGGGYAGFFAVTPNGAFERYGAGENIYNVLQFGALGANTGALTAIRQIGQQLVDTDGNIYTVVALPTERDNVSYDSAKSVVIAPPLTVEAARSLKPGGGTNSVAVQFLVSPVIPASVEVTVIRP